jgi:hypothetical protein
VELYPQVTHVVLPCTCTVLNVMFVVGLGIRERNFLDFYFLGLDTTSSGRHFHWFTHRDPLRNALKLKKWF